MEIEETTNITQVSDQLVKQLIDSYGERELYVTLSKLLGFENIPPSIDEFLQQDDWLGEQTNNGDGIYLPWRETLRTIYPNSLYSPFAECCLSGSIGSGKTTVAIVGALYDLTKLLHMKNPQEFFSLLPTTRIAYAIINATIGLALDVVFDQMVQLIKNSKGLKAFMAGKGQAFQGSTIFKNNINIIVGSKPTHALGTAVIGAILDELNFATGINKSYDNYTTIKRRVQSRYLLPGGSYPARVWMVSSKKNTDSFLEGHISANANSPDTLIRSYSIWDIQRYKPGVKFSGEEFQVFIGDSNHDPKLLEGKGDSYGLDVSRVINVPVEYKREFQRDINNALRDLAGVSAGSTLKFIPSTEVIKSCLLLKNPIYKDVITLDFWDKTDRLDDYIDWKNIIIPQYRHSARYVHIDIGLKHDKLGISSTFVSTTTQQSRFDSLAGEVINTVEPNYITEFVICIEAKSSSEVPLYKVKEFLHNLKTRGYPLAKVTMDGFQSDNLRQDLLILGIQAELLSVDRTKNPYETFKAAMISGRWMSAKHSVLARELDGLLDVGAKIDHPALGSKDLADSVSGSLFSAYNEYSKFGLYNSLVEGYQKNPVKKPTNLTYM